MGLLPPHSSGARDLLSRPAWPVLASTFLIGMGLVSLVNALSGETIELPMLDVPEELREMPLVLMAPGLEEVLGTLAEPETVRLVPPWEPLPVLSEGYLLVQPRGDEIPRLPPGSELTGEWETGEWHLSEIQPIELPPPPDEIPLMAELRRARVVFRHPDGRETPCDRWRFGRWSCGLEEWLWVGPTEMPFRGRPRPCLWAHPRAGDTLVITFPGMPIGTRVGGRYGLSDVAVEVPDGASVDFTVRVNDRERTFTAENRPGFSSWQLSTEPAASGDIVFAIDAERDGRRHFCFDAVLRGVTSSPTTEVPTQEGETPRPTQELDHPRIDTPLEVNPSRRRLHLDTPAEAVETRPLLGPVEDLPVPPVPEGTGAP